MSVKQCSQCGATVQLEEHVLSTTCAFCDSALVAVDESREPVERVVPFEIDRDAASRRLRRWLSSHWFAPEALRRASRAEELRRVYVPFYAYDALARARWSARVGVYWYRTETYTTRENGKTVTKTRTVRETEWFPLSGTYARRWFDHLVSASRGLTEDEANALEPYDLGRALPFAPALTAGVLAEHPTVPHDEAERVAASELGALQEEVVASEHLPGDTHGELSCSTQTTVEEVELVLLPVWIAVYRGPDGPVRLLVNGQTGEAVGEVPTSSWKIGCLVAAILATLVVAAAVFLGVGGLITLLGESG